MEVLNEFQSNSIDDCIEACIACYQECLKCLNHCLIMGGIHTQNYHIKGLLECAQVCNTCSNLLRLEGKYSDELCQICARVCEDCEASCLSIGKDDSVMIACAQKCRICADSCKRLVPH